MHMSNLFGPNWKTTVSGIAAAIFAGLTALAGLPYELGNVGIPPEWKSPIFKYGLAATIVLKFWNSIAQKDRNVTGGSVQQTLGGNYTDEGKQNLVDATKAASPPEERHNAPES